jgi:hypothetical protein
LANEYNPVACSALEATVDYPLRYDTSLAKSARQWEHELRKRFNKRMEDFFPRRGPIPRHTYLFARTVPCPEAGHETPLVPDWSLLKPKSGLGVVAEPVVDKKNGTWTVRIREIGEGRGHLRQAPTPTCRKGKGISLFTGTVIPADYIKAKAQAGEMGNLLKAIEFASRKHSTQRRKDKDASPYINHPIAVTHLLADTGGVTDLVTLMAAVLHDIFEDTNTTPEELEAQFGRTVRKVVEEVTDDKSLDKAVRKQLQVDHASHLSPRAKAIKLADRIANVRDVTDAPPAKWDLARRIDYLDWTENVVAGCRGTNAPLEKLYDEVLKRGRAKFRS